MALQITTASETNYNPVFLEILSEVPGGGTIATDRVPGTCKVLEEGTMLANSNTDGVYQFVKTGVVASSGGATVTHYLLKAPAHFIAGEFLSVAGGCTSATIASVTRATNTVTVVANACLGALVTAGAVVFEGTTTATGNSTGKYLPSLMLKNTVEVRSADYTTLQNVFSGIVNRANVDESNMPYFPTTVQKANMTDYFLFA